jgi:hypothetical protein
MPFEMYMSNRRLYFGPTYTNRPRRSIELKESDETYQLKSFLNVIADSGVVEAYLLTKLEMQYLPDEDLKVVYDSICQVREPDRPSTEDQVVAWFEKAQNDEKDRI